ncbi:MAG: signal peptidase II [Thermostichales cyanobacterium HHBFW_bins_127]
MGKPLLPGKNAYFWLLGGLGFCLDQATKLWAVRVLQPLGEIQLWPGVFHLTYVTNPGAAWSLFAEGGEFLRWVSLGVCLVLMAWAWWGKGWNLWEQAGYGCILAGAAGNGWDRFTLGYVVDFLNAVVVQVPGPGGWSTFPVFNLADVLINLGVGCLILAAYLSPGRSP